MVHRFFTLAFLLIASCQGQINMIWGGDFQYYNGPWQSFGESLLAIQSSNSSGWYNSMFGIIQIKKIITFTTTQGCDLSVLEPYTLCQNTTLNPGRKYQLSYTVYSDKIFSSMDFKAWLNGVPISTLYIPTPNTFGNATSYFHAEAAINEICFNQTHQYIPSVTGMNYIGGLLDNITLFQTKFYEISFTCQMQQQNSKFYLISNISYQENIMEELKRKYYLAVKGVVLQNCTYGFTADNIFFIQTYSNMSFCFSQLSFFMRNQTIKDQMIQFSLKINDTSSYFHALSNSQIKALTISSILLQFITKILASISSLLKISFCSYFIFYLVSFENLSLFYIFLDMKVIPTYTRKIYHQLLYISFIEEGIQKWIYKMLNIENNPFYFEAEANQIQQLIEDKHKSMYWFGTYDFSSLVLNNNCQNFFLLGFLALKLLLAKLILKFISKENKKKLGIKQKFSIIFIVEFLGLIPTFVISATPRILTSFTNFPQGFSKSMQVIITFCCLFSLVLHLVINNKHTKIKRKKINRNCHKIQPQDKKLCQKLKIEKIDGRKIIRFRIKPKKQQKQKQSNFLKIEPIKLSNKQQVSQKLTTKQKSQFNNGKIQKLQNQKEMAVSEKRNRIYADQSYNMLLFTIPFFAYLGEVRLFLTINGTIIILRVFLFFRKCSSKKNFLKVLQFLKIGVWILQHSVFVAFYIIDSQMLFNSELYKFSVPILGIISILAVLIGCIIEIVMLLVQLTPRIYSLLKRSYEIAATKCKKKQSQKLAKINNKAQMLSVNDHPMNKNKIVNEAIYIQRKKNNMQKIMPNIHKIKIKKAKQQK